jgi:CBS domain-containing protein
MAGKARDIMTQGAECVGENQTLVEAARKMRDLDVGALPICGEDDRLKGMLTDRDIVVKCIAEGGDPSSVKAGSYAEGKPVTIGADDSVDEVLATMSKYQVKRLPVIDGHRMVGIISQQDLAQHASEQDVGETVDAIKKG